MARALLLLFCSSIGTLNAAIGQAPNLVADPGFEDRTDCPKRFTWPHEKLPLASWWLPSYGTADLLSTCSKAHDVSVPDNLFGHQHPRSGECYAGFGVESDGYAEYLQTRLTRSLRKGATYEVSFHVCLADNSSTAVKKLGAHLGKQRMDVHDTKAFYLKAQARVDTAITDTANWSLISRTFVAAGGELYLTIGCFPGYHVQTERVSTHPEHAQRFAYYFVDDVSVTEVKGMDDAPAAKDPVTAAPAPFVLGDLLFDHDRADLRPGAIRALDAFIAERLKGYDGKITITGHTDDTGTEPHNLVLSRRRAETVAAYLRSKGIATGRIKVNGLGSAQPVADNTTEEGRRANRRVEITLEKR